MFWARAPLASNPSYRSRHYGLSANGGRAENLLKAGALLHVVTHNDVNDDCDDVAPVDWLRCPSRGEAMRIIEIFEPGHAPCATAHRGGDPP